MERQQIITMNDNNDVDNSMIDDVNGGEDDNDVLMSDSLETYFKSGYEVLKTQQEHYGHLLEVVKQELIQAASDLNYPYSQSTKKKRMVHLLTHIVDYKQGIDEKAIRVFCRNKTRIINIK